MQSLYYECDITIFSHADRFLPLKFGQVCVGEPTLFSSNKLLTAGLLIAVCCLPEQICAFFFLHPYIKWLLT